MTPEGRQKIRQLLLRHESFRQFPYSDTTGHLTIGIGRNISDRGISQAEALVLLDDDISYFYNRINQYCSYFSNLDENRQIALIDMCFNVGFNGFLNFHNMHAALEKGDYEKAYEEILNSKWYQQVGERGINDALIVKTGEL